MTNTLIQSKGFIAGRRKAVLSASAVALLVGYDTLDARVANAASTNPKQDVGILNTALGLEQEAIAVYQVGAESGLISPGTLKVAVTFQSQHKEHAAALEATIRKLGGKPVAPKSKDEYAKVVMAAAPKNEADVLRLAARLEKGAANAYLGVIPSFTDPMLAQVSARLAADEIMHFVALQTVLGIPLPGNALSFGG